MKPKHTFVAMAIALAAALPATSVHAQEPFLGEIMWVGFTFCPRGWTEADGQLLPITEHAALFSLYGTTYGGDGRRTFALPDLRGRVALHVGEGPGLTSRTPGSAGGAEMEALSVAQMPGHTHSLHVSSSDGIYRNGANGVLASSTVENGNQGKNNGNSPQAYIYDGPRTADQQMSPESIGSVGGDQAHNNMQPFLTLRACVALFGLFPSRD